MIELPEAITLAKQLQEELKGLTVTAVINAKKRHGFTFFYEDPTKYHEILKGRTMISSKSHGGFVDVFFDDGCAVTFNEGICLYYGNRRQDIPESYQLIIAFDNGCFLAMTVRMYAGIAVYRGVLENRYHDRSLMLRSVMNERFDFEYFSRFFKPEVKSLSVKEFLATGQRFPGIGNGVLHDILFNSSINPRRKIASLTAAERVTLFGNIKSTLRAMIDGGGRDTERDLYGMKGGYKTLMSRNSYKAGCPKCGGPISKESFLGGTIYYCISCQPLIS